MHYVGQALTDTARQTTKFSRYAQVRTGGGNLAPQNDEVRFRGALTTGMPAVSRWSTSGGKQPNCWVVTDSSILRTPRHQVNESFTPTGGIPRHLEGSDLKSRPAPHCVGQGKGRVSSATLPAWLQRSGISSHRGNGLIPTPWPTLPSSRIGRGSHFADPMAQK